MYNWSVDEKQFKKADPEGYRIWRLEQMINYGEAHEKLDRDQIIKYWDLLKNRIDPTYRKVLELWLWPRKRKVF